MQGREKQSSVRGELVHEGKESESRVRGERVRAVSVKLGKVRDRKREERKQRSCRNGKEGEQS